MKALALNSSARIGRPSKTELMLKHLVEGMRDAGAEVEVVNLYKKKINFCIGCFTCWSKTPGQCIHKDDMSEQILPKYIESDLVILATPLYNFTVNAQLKVFMERTLPMLEPFFEMRDGVTRHPMRHEPPCIVVLSVAGFPEESVFEQLSSFVNSLYRDNLLAEIYRTASEALSGALSKGCLEDAVKDIFEATIQGGRELVRFRKISTETMARIKQPLIGFETMSTLGNVLWQTCIDEGVTPKELEEKRIIPRPNSLETFLALMTMGINSKKVGDIKGTIQFSFSGQVQGECHITIANGKVECSPKPAENPDLNITAVRLTFACNA